MSAYGCGAPRWRIVRGRSLGSGRQGRSRWPGCEHPGGHRGGDGAVGRSDVCIARRAPARIRSARRSRTRRRGCTAARWRSETRRPARGWPGSAPMIFSMSDCATGAIRQRPPGKRGAACPCRQSHDNTGARPTRSLPHLAVSCPLGQGRSRPRDAGCFLSMGAWFRRRQRTPSSAAMVAACGARVAGDTERGRA